MFKDLLLKESQVMPKTFVAHKNYIWI